MSSVQVAAYQPLDVSGFDKNFDFVLADQTKVSVNAPNNDKISIQIQSSSSEANKKISLTTDENIKVPISLPQGVMNADRVVSSPTYILSLDNDTDNNKNLDTESLWTVLYALWLRRSEDDALPLTIRQDNISNANELREYLSRSGLGLILRGEQVSDLDHEVLNNTLLVSRATFWQANGSPRSKSWINPGQQDFTTDFPYIKTFTKATNVCTVHPLRPPKPEPGTVIYSRYIRSLGETLSLIHIDPSNPQHFEAYSRWQNSDRVNVGWRERGPEEHHRKYLADRLADPHIFGVMVCWNGELGGYGEIAWVKEDHMASFTGTDIGEFDAGTHYLCGEDKFRGRHRFTAVMTSLKHYCFLRDPRTQIVVGEPRADLPIIPRLIAFLPQEFNREFELPHKRSVYFVLRRERFFDEATIF